MKLLFIFIFFMLISFLVNAQLDIGAEYRPRFEFRDGYKTLKSENTNPAYFTTQRTRLNLNHTNKYITSRISIQDYRVWGESKLKSDDPGISVYEAWFKINLNTYWSLTAGRQSFDIDNKRLFSKANWSQVSNSHDGINIDYLNENFQLKIFTAFNQSSVSNFGTDYSGQINNYKFLNVLWLEKTLNNFSLASLTITDGYQKEGTTNTDYYRLTTGGIIKYQKPADNIQIRGFYQTGKNYIGQDVSAFYLSGSFLHKFNPWLDATAGIEYKSGNDLSDETNQKDYAFDILYGARHGFNGMMDYFSTPETTEGAGLLDGYIKIDISRLKNWKLSARYHYFALANNYVYENTVQNKFLANEFDLITTWNLNEIVNLQMGYGILFSSKTLELIQATEPNGLQQFLYAMITVKPTFFNQTDR
ncbi:MAG: alginate export family protein [Bacteroidales bacterium]